MKSNMALLTTWITISVIGSSTLFPALASSGSNGRQTAVGPSPNGVYIVQLKETPVVAYAGDIPGLKATKPQSGQKIDPTSPVVVNYVGYLSGRHNDVLRAAGGSRLYDYYYAFNGFAARMTQAQANRMTGMAGVLQVTPDSLQNADTSSTPAFLGLSSANSLWAHLGGTDRAGDGIIIGLVDTGIWPESLSFSDRVGLNGNASKDGKLAYQQIPGWHGKCTPGEAFVASLCNQKLIGAQWFNQAWGGNAAIDASMPWEFSSARDYNGHGTHTSSTAGGNTGVEVTGPAAAYGKISGMAPHVRIAMYKALWTQPDGTGSGYTSDLQAAVDQAVADGVDVINYSISGTSTNFRDPVQISFMYAAQAGIFVATSAGNSGPTTATVSHPSPWVATVAAGTHNRTAVGAAVVHGTTYSGASLSTAIVTAPLVNAADAALPGADAYKVKLCYAAADNGGSPVLNPLKVAGKIVVCDRGVTARVNKSLAVFEAGGVGMILINPASGTLNADFHSVPTVHLPDAAHAPVHASAALPGATAVIHKATMDYTSAAPFTASFSSRGPLRASGDLLKPDLMAPGQDILAAVAPPGNGGLSFALYSGTSMSSPHVAGLAALLKQAHPDWTPMMIKSALMTTAYDVLDNNISNASRIFRQGAGHVRPNEAVNPGLVFDSGINDWLGFLCGTQLPSVYCSSRGIPVLSPSNFNSPSLAIAALTGSRTVTRTVTNVGPKATYTVEVSGLDGLTVNVSPATFTLNPGQKQVLTITVSRVTAALHTYVGGYLTWSDNAHRVRIPVEVQPAALSAPSQVSGSYSVTFGYSGTFSASPRGLVPAVTLTKSAGNGQLVPFPVNIPAGTTYARFSLFDAHVTPGSDLDLYVYQGSTLIGYSGSATSTEEVSLLNPEAGDYTVVVEGYATANPSHFTLFYWALGSAAAGNMAVSAPTTAVMGNTGVISLSFSGLTPGVKYLGSVVYGGEEGMPNPTIVRVDPSN